MKFTYDGKTIELKFSFKSLMIYENIQKKSFTPETLSDIIVFFYSCILACDINTKLTFDRFIELLDEKPELLTEFSEFITTYLTNTASAAAPNDEPAPKEDTSKNL